jgi:hypothetical protein
MALFSGQPVWIKEKKRQKHTTLEEVNRLIQKDYSFASQLILCPNERLQDLERQLENIAHQITQFKQRINKRF